MSVIPCPGCETELKRHCPSTNPTCTWRHCQLCKITIDIEGWRAFDHDGKRYTLPPRTS